MSRFNPEEHPYIQQVLARAAEDPSFRARLLKHPHTAIKEETGINVPPDFAIWFVQQPGMSTVTVQFPERSTDADMLAGDAYPAEDELSLDDLEAAAGGTTNNDPESPW